ncbi:hypothetical protein [Mesorhizobium sp. M2C.T.Ca.TU.002.02.1.1]|uniref:hypothetical protein n=1 Tax=Mesorhizobium sp. M2C.T.Ca.TU.002.02.1.1 TaxID=2496788 RepID=UPI000FCA17B4|nr:hypothetical protein [Mesorhizobium sp. M2C.T.Ca.TU.002.02.1.1]RUU59934.1 hypothetical protein EOD07_05575 [Mesorhizobium sp. M2C.T.Ca.TU.002.02.1.1]
MSRFDALLDQARSAVAVAAADGDFPRPSVLFQGLFYRRATLDSMALRLRRSSGRHINSSER